MQEIELQWWKLKFVHNNKKKSKAEDILMLIDEKTKNILQISLFSIEARWQSVEMPKVCEQTIPQNFPKPISAFP